MTRIKKFGIIGACGIIGKIHIEGILKNESYARLHGIFDINQNLCQKEAGKLGVRPYTSLEELLNDKRIDCVTIATPHPLHAMQAVNALKAGKHVLCEKPMAVTIKEADQMIDESRKSKRVLGICFQWRLNPMLVSARQIIKKGEIGRVYRIYTEILGLKTDAYYKIAPWRGSWKGEGGGFMLNSASHIIDLMVDLTGMPVKVWAISRTVLQDIESDDSVTAVLEYKDGAQGVFVSCSEAIPARMGLKIYGDKGSIIIDEKNISLYKHAEPLSKYVRRNDLRDIHASSIETNLKDVKLPKTIEGHEGLIRNFCKAIDGYEELICPGEEGIKSMEIINAITLSSYTESAVTFPVDRREYDLLFHKLTVAGKKARHLPLKPSPVKQGNILSINK